MKISFGILAYNEEVNIVTTIRSLFSQYLFSEIHNGLSIELIEIVLVPNGCKDATADVGQKTFDELSNNLALQNVTCKVETIIEPGKSNAWNRYIHEFSNKDADFIFLMDADIEFGYPETLTNMVRAIQENPDAHVVVDTPLKDITKKERLSIMERISVSASDQRLEGTPAIAGSLYCSRAAVLRNIWMPIGLSGEDGFLKGMITTDQFRSKPNSQRVIRAENATHYYEAESTFRGIFKHELRLVIGTVLNCYFCWDFLVFATDPSGPGAGILIRNQMLKDANWYNKYIQNQVKSRGIWVLPRWMIFRRFRKLKKSGSKNFFKYLPVALAGFLLDLPVLFVANHKIKKGTAIGFW